MAQAEVEMVRVPPALRGGRKRGRRTSGIARQRSRAGIVLTLPAFAVVVVLLIIPIGEAVYYSMTNWDGITAHWVGPGTYVHLVQSPTFWRVLENNGLLLLALPIAVFIPLVIAGMLHEHVWGWKVFRSLIFLPTAVSWVVIGIVAMQVFAANGTVNSLLGALGLKSLEINFLGFEYSALGAVAVTFIWSMVGTNTIIFLTGMSTIDPAIYEAARLDGAGRLMVFRHITLPLLKRYFQFGFVITTISAFTGLFSLIFIMTEGGPGYGTTTLEFYVYQQAFAIGAFGTGATVGIVLLIIIFGVNLLQMRILRGEN